MFDRGKRRRVTSLALRVLATVAVLVWLSRHVHVSELRMPSWRAETMMWLAASGMVTTLGVVLSAWRWQLVLAAMGVRARVSGLLNHYLAGLFVGNVLPTTIGGDVVRVSRLSVGGIRTPQALASVALERLTGWLVLPVLTMFALYGNRGLRRQAPASTEMALTVAFLTLGLLAVVLLVVSSSQFGRLLHREDGWRRFTGALHLGLEGLQRRPGVAFEVVTVGFAYQVTVMLAAFLAAKAMGLTIGWTAVLAFFPIVAVVQVLPLTIGGLGMREAALVFFLHPLGVAQPDAFALGLLVYLVNVAVSLLGAPAFAAGTRPARAVV